MKNLKNVFLFVAGIVLSFVFFAGVLVFWYLSISLQDKMVLMAAFYSWPVFLFFLIFFVRRKNKILASGMLLSAVFILGFSTYVTRKAVYENSMWPVIGYPGRIMLNSNAPEAQYVHVESGLPLVTVAGQPHNIYYSKEGKIVATHPGSDERLYAEIKKDTKKLNFNFNRLQ